MSVINYVTQFSSGLIPDNGSARSSPRDKWRNPEARAPRMVFA